MAEILIRGISIPRNCFECPLFTNCDACEGHECGCGLLGGIGYEEDISEDRRRDDCPLNELPEHWDLIDLSAVQYTYTMQGGVKMTSNKILERMSVIVPASNEDLNTMDEFMRGQECGNPEDGSL